MSREFDFEINRLLHTITFILNEEAEIEKDFYRAKKKYHDRHIKIRERMELAKQEVFELIRIKGIEDDKIKKNSECQERYDKTRTESIDKRNS